MSDVVDRPIGCCHAALRVSGDAIFRARVVLEVVDEATEDVLGKVRESLPAELTSLVDAGSSGSLGGG